MTKIKTRRIHVKIAFLCPVNVSRCPFIVRQYEVPWGEQIYQDSVELSNSQLCLTVFSIGFAFDYMLVRKVIQSVENFGSSEAISSEIGRPSEGHHCTRCKVLFASKRHCWDQSLVTIVSGAIHGRQFTLFNCRPCHPSHTVNDWLSRVCSLLCGTRSISSDVFQMLVDVFFQMLAFLMTMYILRRMHEGCDGWECAIESLLIFMMR